jgi:hypothetical protein
MHEIVLKKRLEQLRRKQREEASKVQEELETALASHGGHVYGEGVGEDMSLEEEKEEEEEDLLIEPYDPYMSPRLTPKLTKEDKQLDILIEFEDYQQLVCDVSSLLSHSFIVIAKY